MLNFTTRVSHLLQTLLLLAVTASIPVSACSPAGAGSASAEDLRAVRLITKREGDRTRFYVENMEYCEITMTFELGLVNLKSDKGQPFTGTFAPRQTSEAFCLEPIDSCAKWAYTYTNYYKLGSSLASHDDSCIYQLPYLPGAKYTVTQGYNGSFSHKGSNLYAVDWKMPEGTVVCAARGGVVVKARDDSNTGGGSMKFDKFNNFVLIRHDDGTLGHYCHLQKDGVLVKVGERVVTGQPIAHSGNTGFSSGPHLHFCVFRTKNGRERESIPVKFHTSGALAVTLQEDRRYKAAKPLKATVLQADKGAVSAQGAATIPSVQ